MNDRNEIAQLRLLDAFLENGETDRHDWRDEVGAALDRARMSRPRDTEPMPESHCPPSAAAGKDAGILAQIGMMESAEAGGGMTFVEFDESSRYWKNITDDDLEITSAVARRIR